MYVQHIYSHSCLQQHFYKCNTVNHNRQSHFFFFTHIHLIMGARERHNSNESKRECGFFLTFNEFVCGGAECVCECVWRVLVCRGVFRGTCWIPLRPLLKDKYVKRGISWTEKDAQCEIAPLP